ncbi:hypothetical protein J8I29_19620 [Labrys sp. LIt4]|uniref:hypothetical protein n=1 Tax=Labrys sp. LIt4 TaxID=2821355 RepID=UPI001ADF95D9|nr:hypothetical protein [Labrys sp. LIt4]MBP0581546.1 hypothetical protein [Labrys sp. LIt4]
MGDTFVGLQGLVALAGFLFLAFRHTLPFHYRMRERSEINRHSSHGETENGSNWSNLNHHSNTE